MPGFLLTQSVQALCAHGAPAKPTVPMPRVKVMGAAVLPQAGPFAVSGCPNQTTTVPPAPFPCVVAQFTTGSTRVKAMGMPLLLADGQASATPTGTPLTVVPPQARVKGI